MTKVGFLPRQWIMLAVLGSFLGYGFPTCEGCLYTKGKEFVLSFLESFENANNQPWLYITSTSDTSVTIEAPADGYTTTVDVSADEKVIVTLPRSSVEMSGSQPDSKAVYVTSDQDINLLAVSDEGLITGAYRVLPISFLGSEYFIPGYSASGQLSEFGVISAYPDTTVTITPTQDVTFDGAAYPAGTAFDVELGEYEGLQVQSAGDLTGVSR
ncbi:IgGFc-binding protein-like [Branchiostoma floridae x Branchiostoma japonicum]